MPVSIASKKNNCLKVSFPNNKARINFVGFNVTIRFRPVVIRFYDLYRQNRYKRGGTNSSPDLIRFTYRSSLHRLGRARASRTYPGPMRHLGRARAPPTYPGPFKTHRSKNSAGAKNRTHNLMLNN